MDQSIQNLLQDYLIHSSMSKPGLKVGEVTHLSNGWESELYQFILEYGNASAPQRAVYILRIYPGDGAVEKSAREFNSMQRLHQVGYPVPRVHLLEYQASPFGKPFMIMEWIEGEALWPRLSRSAPAEQMALLSRFCQLFVQLHQLDWHLFSDERSPEEPGPYTFIDQWLANAHDILGKFPQVNFHPVLDWVAKRRQALACSRLSPAHQDFHPNNILLKPDGTMIVIDWTNFEITDARIDLAWTLILALGYEGAAVRDLILGEYERCSGSKVREIETFEVLAAARRLFDIAVSISQGAERLGMRPEAVAMMKQQMHAHQRVYEHMQHITGIRLPEIERIFSD